MTLFCCKNCHKPKYTLPTKRSDSIFYFACPRCDSPDRRFTIENFGIGKAEQGFLIFLDASSEDHS